MKNKIKKIIILLFTFIFIFLLHVLYFRLTEESCAGISWFKKYLRDEEYYLGISYAFSFVFIVFAFLKFKENRKNALRAAFGGGLLTIILWLFCFLFGCCGSPMLIIYLNLIGLSSLKVHKSTLLLMTVIFIGIGYIWLIRKTSEGCCNGKPCNKIDK